MFNTLTKGPIEAKIALDYFKPRSYQWPTMDALFNKGYKRLLLIKHRRAGKDILAWNCMIRYLIQNPCLGMYIFPTFAHAKRVIWHGKTNSNDQFLDYLPPQLIKSKNSQELIIHLVNGASIMFVGSDNVDALMGTNAKFMIFSEYALQDPRAYSYLRPILVANDGIAMFVSTPRGRNHLYDLYEVAKDSPEWFVQKLSVEDTGVITQSQIQAELDEGLISDDMIQQEYYCSFESGLEGSYYGKYLDRMRLNGQVGTVPWEPYHKVHTSWDIGVSDSSVILWFQCIGQQVRIIDYYENKNVGLDHYVSIINAKPYTYGKHMAPHDMRQRVWSEGAITRIEKARKLGINFTIAPEVEIYDGIETVRSTLGKIWIDEGKCFPLIKAIENYRKVWDHKRKVYHDKPLHDNYSHAADALRYLCLSISKVRDGIGPEELQKRYQEAVMGEQSAVPYMFRDTPNFRLQ